MSQGDAALRVLVLAPTSRDAELSHALLERAGITVECCRDLPAVCAQLHAEVGAVVVPEEALTHDQRRVLMDWLGAQPPWSDLPIIVMARPGADSTDVAQAMDLLGNVTVVERPVRFAALISALRSALRARQRQHQLRVYLAERKQTEIALREADRRKDEFLAMLAHELRNPLAPIRNSLQILRLSAPRDASIDGVTQIMERQVNHMVRLVDDLLEMSRVTRGRIELRIERVELASVLRSAVETSRPLIDAARHRLTVALPAEPLYLEGDPMRMAQVFSNLLNNAAKYTDEGGQIALSARREGSSVAIRVRDNGTGIPPEMLPRVFDLFMQLPGTERRAHGGLGIGLTLVKTLVEMHRGTVEARSAGIGKGSEFTVLLPLAVDDARAEAPAATPRGDAKLPPRRVLVVDDNRDAAESLGLLLELLGHTLKVVHSGAAALEAVAGFKPSVVFLDIGMPEMDGYEVARRIRSDPALAGLPLVAMTGWGQEEDRRRTQLAGFDHHLIKPVDVRALESLLQGLEARDGGKPGLTSPADEAKSRKVPR